MADKTSPCGGGDRNPRRPDNRAGLDRIDYRITTQPESHARMTWRLPRQKARDPSTGENLYPLRALRTRDLSDPTISLIDAWAMASDVLSFYSERVANEGYIGTAAQRRSVLELARMVGYELSPGVAASTHLAFTVESSDDPYRMVEVGEGVQAMSIPARKDELPQIFETVEAITARAEWNEIHARTERPQNLALYVNPEDDDDALNGELYLFDLDGSFDAGVISDPDLGVIAFTAEEQLANYHPLSRRFDLPSALAKRIEDGETNDQIAQAIYALPVDEICLQGLGLNLRPGARVLAVGQAGDGPVTAMPLRVVSSEEDKPFQLTRVVLTRSGKAPEKVRRSPLFALAILSPGKMPSVKVPLDSRQIDTYVRGSRWTGDGLSALVQSQNWQRAKMMTLIAKVLSPPPEDDGDDIRLGLHVMRENAGFFGNSAPRYETLNFGEEDEKKTKGTIKQIKTETNKKNKGPYTRNWDDSSTPNTIWMDAVGADYPGPARAYLEREVKEIQPNSWAVLEAVVKGKKAGVALGLRVTHAATESRADYAITGKATGLAFETAAGVEVNPGGTTDSTIYNNFLFRSSQIYANSEHIPLSGVPLSQELEASASSIELDRLYLDLERGRPVSVSGARLDAEGITGRETQIISEVQHIDGVTRLLFDGETAYPYDRTTVRLNANVALATHGELVEEDLGSGDARLAHQSFTLAKPPLTFVSAANETGRASTLEVRVAGVLWTEIPALGQAGPDDAVYELRLSDDGASHVKFGDGAHGRRLPTGELNVTARYRSGIGTVGEVAEEAISQLKTKPLGVRSVVNPSPAANGADRETLASAKLNAPAAVKTLGRIVSLTDYEDFASSFSGVGKAQVRQLWSGRDKVAHLTVAPESDSELTESSTLLSNLIDAVEKVRDPACAVVVQPYARRLFALTALLNVDPAYLLADVELAASRILESRFGYDARSLAQPVSAAEVISALHAVDGVISADLDALAILLDGDVVGGGGTSLEALLPALPARGPGQRGAGDEFSPAELLTVLPSAITLTSQEAVDA